jgi:hypothetical protein
MVAVGKRFSAESTSRVLSGDPLLVSRRGATLWRGCALSLRGWQGARRLSLRRLGDVDDRPWRFYGHERAGRALHLNGDEDLRCPVDQWSGCLEHKTSDAERQRDANQDACQNPARITIAGHVVNDGTS